VDLLWNKFYNKTTSFTTNSQEIDIMDSGVTAHEDFQLAEIRVIGHWKLHDDISGRRHFAGTLQECWRVYNYCVLLVIQMQ